MTVTGKDSSKNRTGAKREEKDVIMELLRQEGFRVTRQRKLLIEIILEENCNCCKEVYILASGKDPGIGMATVYRTVDVLERVGVLKRRIPYQLCDYEKNCKRCLVELEVSSVLYRLIEKTVRIRYDPVTVIGSIPLNVTGGVWEGADI